MPIVPLFGQSYYSRSSNVTRQLAVNLYSEPQRDNDKTPLAFFGTPGLTLLYDLGGVVRGAASVGNVLYAVVGTALKAVTASGTIVALGTVTTSSGPVWFSWNGTQLMFVDGQTGWIYTPSTGVLAQIVDGEFPAAGASGPATCTWLAGYFFVSVAGTGKFQWSKVLDGMTWDALDFATAESAPDNMVRIEADNGMLVLFGERTTEFWGMSGDASVVRRVGGAGIEWGCVAAQTVAKFTTGLAFLAQNRLGEVQVAVLNGYQVASLTDSSPDVSHDINSRSRASLAAATAFSYFMDGHPFYQLNFPDKSYLYDAYADHWSQVSSSSTFGARHYANIRVALQQQPYVADYRNGRIYLLDKAAYSDNGDPIIRELTSRHVFTDYERRSVTELQIDFEEGTGLNTGQGSDPQAMLQISKDGGHSWSSELWTTIGAMGNYTTRAIWRRLGIARDWLFKVRISDPVKVVIIGGGIKVQ